MTPARRLAVPLALALALGACGGEDTSGGDSAAEGSGGGGGQLEGQTITVGSKDFDEQLVLGQIALRTFEDAGAEVVDSTRLAGTDAARAALTSSQVDTYWEYTGTAWISLLGNTDPVPGSTEQYEAVRDADLEANDVVWLPPAPLDNTFAVATGPGGDVTTLSQWATFTSENPGEATFCTDPEFQNRDDGLPGLSEAYGTTVPEESIALVDIGVIYDQLASGGCRFGVVSATDGRIAANDLTVLEDDQQYFPVYNPSLTFLSSRLEELPGVEEVIAPVTEALTTEEITALNERVSVDGELPETVAEEWLTENGLIGG